MAFVLHLQKRTSSFTASLQGEVKRGAHSGVAGGVVASCGGEAPVVEYPVEGVLVQQGVSAGLYDFSSYRVAFCIDTEREDDRALHALPPEQGRVGRFGALRVCWRGAEVAGCCGCPGVHGLLCRFGRG